MPLRPRLTTPAPRALARLATTLATTLGAALAAPLAAQGPAAPAASNDPGDAPPPVAREFRAAWVASVANIDWPSRPGLATWDQQAELLQILNRAVALRLNAVILQVRPAADALYASRHEPWSEYLTGEMGRAPEPMYDPLAFAVEEAHKRGLELHAWFNPFRAHHPSGTQNDFAATHVSRAQPGVVRTYGRQLWLDPGDPAVRRHSLRVILDVVRRYDVDGVHIDDYFYPYRERDSAGVSIDFPDSASYARYRRGGGTLARDDWRRRNVDEFVRELYAGVRSTKRWVKVGVSPFGIWRPGHPEPVRGLDAYQEIYADSRRWLENGWLDYFSPQLYWPAAAPEQPYSALLRWWVERNAKRRHIWPGNFTSRVGGADARQPWAPGEILEQVRLTRAQPGAGGNVHFSMRALMQNRAGIADSLAAGPYAAPALVPASPWLGAARPARPTARVRRDTVAGGLAVTMAPAASGKAPRLWVVQARFPGGWSTAVLPGWQRTHTLTTSDSAAAPAVVAVTAVDRLGNASPAALVRPALLPARPLAAGR